MTNDFYKDKELQPNPYYIGFGNPKSKLLFIGKEKAFDLDKLEHLKNESIDNPIHWDCILTGNVNELSFNPSYPYNGDFNPNGGRDLWRAYDKIYKKLNEIHRISDFKDTFHKNIFFTELNHIPSKKTKDRNIVNLQKRKDLFKNNSFFQ